MKKRIRNTICLLVCLLLLLESSGSVQAVTIEELRKQIEENQNQLNSENEVISGLQDEQDLIDEEISDLDAELVNLYTEISKGRSRKKKRRSKWRRKSSRRRKRRRDASMRR